MTQALLFDPDGTREQVEPLIGQGAPALIERALQISGQRHLVADSDRLLTSFFTALARDLRSWPIFDASASICPRSGARTQIDGRALCWSPTPRQ
jgi:hypothetical protein